MTDSRKDDDAADEEDDDKLKEGHLRAWTACQHAHGKQKEEVANDGVDDSGHGGPVLMATRA